MDDNSYTSESYHRDFVRLVLDRMNGTLVARLSSFSSQLLDSHRHHLHPDEIHFSSRSCERSECDAVRERALGNSSTIVGCSRGSIDIPTGCARADASARWSRSCDTFCSLHVHFGTKPVTK